MVINPAIIRSSQIKSIQLIRLFYANSCQAWIDKMEHGFCKTFAHNFPHSVKHIWISNCHKNEKWPSDNKTCIVCGSNSVVVFWKFDLKKCSMTAANLDFWSATFGERKLYSLDLNSFSEEFCIYIIETLSILCSNMLYGGSVHSRIWHEGVMGPFGLKSGGHFEKMVGHF